jgi:aspartate/methionine/tyrosine aminotransferase
MSSSTKARILQLYEENAFLRTPLLPPISAGDGDLSADDLVVPLEERIIAAASEALEAGQTHYVDVPGIAPLRQAVAAYLRDMTGADYQQPNIVVTAGMQEARFLTIQMIGEHFDRIAIPAVVHPGVRKAIGVRPMKTEHMPVDPTTLLPTVDAVRAALESGTRLMYLEAPSRLTGAAYSAEQVSEIAGLISTYEATVIWDQGLAPWTTAYRSLVANSGLMGRTALIGEAFPGMGLASWHIGYIAAPEAHIQPMTSQKQIMAICTSTAAQYAALEVSKFYGESQPAQVRRLGAKRSQFADMASAAGIDVLPGDAAMVLALRFDAAKKAQAAAALADAGLAAADGAEFGAPETLRLTITYDDAAEKAVRLLASKG